MSRSKEEWAIVDEEYVTGNKPILQIARETGIPESSIRNRAAKLGMLRNQVTFSAERVTELVETAQEAYSGAIKTGVEISMNCLNNLRSISETATEPKEIKLITEATKNAVQTIREIAGLDSPQQGGTINNIQINNAEKIALVIDGLQSKY